MRPSAPSVPRPVIQTGRMPPRLSLPETLLDVRRYGPPPFLVRNLRYVHEHKQSLKGCLWDLEWAKSSYRSAHGPRHLVFSVEPSQCTVTKDFANRAALENPTSSPKIRVAFLHLCLFIQQKDGRKFAFNIRQTKIRVWVKEHVQLLSVLDDVPFIARFDISSYLPLLTAPLGQISLGIRISSLAHPPSPLQLKRLAFPPALVSKVLIWDGDNPRQGTAIPNLEIVVPLQAVLTGYPFECTEDDQVPIVDMMDVRNLYENSIRLKMNGAVQQDFRDTIQSEKPRILVTVEYSSSVVPWQGLIRHDFICPWCHRNCYRFRSLLGHLQVEHEDLKFSLQGTTARVNNDDCGSVPFTIKLDVTAIDSTHLSSISDPSRPNRMFQNPPTSAIRTTMEREDADEVNHINPSRYPCFVEAVRRARDNADMETQMEQVSLSSNLTHAETASTLDDGVRGKPLLSMIRENLWNYCVHCGRRHDRPYDDSENYCSEWCKAMVERQNKENDIDKPLFISTNQPRERKVNYKEAFEKTELYHVVSVSKMKEEHYDEDEPDSEGEVDQSWRLELNIERAQSIKGVTAKEKVLWILWNKFAHKLYPMPSLYGERYTRYTLELFVLEHRAEIEELRLRTQFLGLVKAIHVHGLIDSPAVISIFQCLNGKKKRRDIASSARPEVLTDKKNNVPNLSKRGRNSVMRKKGQPVS